jgi:small-conductance mechanosensitive channel
VTATSVLERAGEQVGAALPQIGLALAVLVVGIVAVRLLARLIRGVLERAGVDQLAERAGVADALARLGLDRSLARVIAAALRLAGIVAVVLAALSLSGLAFLQESLNQGVLFLPRLLAAAALLLAGLVLAGAARTRVDRMAYQMDLRGPLGSIAQTAIVSVALIMALSQIGVSTAILTLLAGIVVGGAVLAVALAFGLGSRDLARTVTAGRYVSAAFAVGQRVELRAARGEIVAIESASTVLATDDGRSVRVPNHMFLDEAVVVERS